MPPRPRPGFHIERRGWCYVVALGLGIGGRDHLTFDWRWPKKKPRNRYRRGAQFLILGMIVNMGAANVSTGQNKTRGCNPEIVYLTKQWPEPFGPPAMARRPTSCRARSRHLASIGMTTAAHLAVLERDGGAGNTYERR